MDYRESQGIPKHGENSTELTVASLKETNARNKKHVATCFVRLKRESYKGVLLHMLYRGFYPITFEVGAFALIDHAVSIQVKKKDIRLQIYMLSK